MKNVRLLVSAVTATCALTVVPLLSQTPQRKPSFEVISIKPSPPLGVGGAIRIGGGTQGDRFAMNGATLRTLLQRAFQRGDNTPLSGQMQIIDGPKWMESDRYDVQAKANCGGGKISREQLALMVQSLLEERFQLKAHMETRELPIYHLVAAKDGPKVKRSADQTPPTPRAAPPGPCEAASTASAPPPPPFAPGGRGDPFAPGSTLPRGTTMIMFSGSSNTMRATAQPFAMLVGLLQQQLGRTVVDKTGLEGLFDFELTFSTEGLQSMLPPGLSAGPPPLRDGAATGPASALPSADPVASIFSAIQELGLKLESSKGPVEVLVIDSVQKPAED